MSSLRAIDLYSGVGGWSLGLKLAGIDVVASFERWGVANETNFKNNRHQTHTVDIRRLGLDELPTNIDIVVGSPPCTQFSFSNRGGNGNLEDGLQDIITFLSIVDAVRPCYWVMENVPRVAGIISEELKPGGRLHRFIHLGTKVHIVNMEDFGLPQRRKRCIAGNFDFDLLSNYRENLEKRTLGQVVQALSLSPVLDPLYGIKLSDDELIDHVVEPPLNYEEVRINRANKMMHTVYNAMPFPDKLDRSVRTITATCTRVSRESIIISDPSISKNYRRLTVRERASLQGFPITFQFYGETYSQKLRMIGNAVPPSFSYLVGHALQGTSAELLPSLDSHNTGLTSPTMPPQRTRPEQPGSKFPLTRKFKFAVPSLQLKSGVRFELKNEFTEHQIVWRVDFFFGTSKEINSLNLTSELKNLLISSPGIENSIEISNLLSALTSWIEDADITNMQRVWSHRGLGGTTPFMLLDRIDLAGEQLIEILARNGDVAHRLIECALSSRNSPHLNKPAGVSKLMRNSALIASGLLISTFVNEALDARRYGIAAIRNEAVAS